MINLHRMIKLMRMVVVLVAFAIPCIIINTSAFALPVCNQTTTLTRPIPMP